MKKKNKKSKIPITPEDFYADSSRFEELEFYAGFMLIADTLNDLNKRISKLEKQIDSIGPPCNGRM